MKSKLLFSVATILATMFIFTQNVYADEQNQDFNLEDVKIMYVNSDNGLHVRVQPSSNAPSLGVVDNNRPVAVLMEIDPKGEATDFIKSLRMIDVDRKWALCVYNDSTAFICLDYLVEEKPEVTEPTAKSTVSSNSLKSGTDLGTYRLTAYEWTGNPCANGNYPKKGYTVAANDLPLGTKIYIEGHGIFTVEDRGGFSGKTLDIYLGDVDECDQFGVKYANVKIIG